MVNRRRIKNILLKPRMQLRYAVRFFAFTAVAVALVQAVSYVLISRVVTRVLEEAGPQAEVLTPVVDMAVRSELLRSAWLLPAICVAALFFTARMLHRFIGPTVPIKKFIERLASGEYGDDFETRAGDEMQDVVASLNGLSTVLSARHDRPLEAERRRLREAGFSLVELLVALAVLMIIGMIVVAQFLTAYDRSRQRGTLADLRTLASANGTYSVDAGDYAPNLSDLAPYYLGTLPPVDRWGYAWQYTHASRAYELSSRGSDGAAGPPAPSGWNGEPYECDLVVENGAFTQAPDNS